MRNYFKNHFVPNNVGLQHINTEQVANRNLLIPNSLFGNPNAPVGQMPAIAICDGTYNYIYIQTIHIIVLRQKCFIRII